MRIRMQMRLRTWMRMRRRLVVCLCLCLCLCLLIGLGPLAAAAEAPLEQLAEALQVLRDMSEQQDFQAMVGLLRKAKGVAIFPSVFKAGIGIGARHGDGLVLRRDPVTRMWYGPSFVQLSGLSWGAQIGIQSTALVLVIMNERGMEGFEKGKITLGGGISFAAGPLGRHAEASTDLELEATIYGYSMSKGAFIGLAFEGASIAADRSANELYWGAALSPDEILSRKGADQRARPLVQELNRLIADAST